MRQTEIQPPLTFDLITEPWIPAIALTGERSTYGLFDLLANAHVLRDLAGDSPLITAALYRFLSAVLHRIYYKVDAEVRQALWVAGAFDSTRVNDYLHDHTIQPHFDLFHPDFPFYQHRALERESIVKPKSVSALMFDVASGNNATLFDHHTDTDEVWVTPAHAARLLITAQQFSLAGLSGLPEKFTDSPLARGVSFWLQGNTLFETLILNLWDYEGNPRMRAVRDDTPVWERNDPLRPARTKPRGYLDYLTYPSRRVVLLTEWHDGAWQIRRILIAPGLKLDPEFLSEDPMKLYRIDIKRGLLPLRFMEERVMWRDSTALFSLQSTEWKVPRAFLHAREWVEEGVLSPKYRYNFIALGMANDQAKVEFFRSERMPLPLAYFEQGKERLADDLRSGVQVAELVSNQLWGASKTLATYWLVPDYDKEDKKTKSAPEEANKVVDQMAVKRHFWAELEPHFRTFVVDLAKPDNRDVAVEAWYASLQKIAYEVFNAAVAGLGENTKAWKAGVQGRNQLKGGLWKLFRQAA